MAKLKQKIRENSERQRKPNVYFSCHPKDFDLYFEEVSGQILQKQDCALWYDANPEEPYEEEALTADLDQMRLFVLPVTERLLRETSRARDVEIPFAIAHCIPVLPLAQEEGLEELFNGCFGELEMLNEKKQDQTAIRFDEKLERFLTTVLTDDKTAQKVREAFDAYIFLSYRKKDRRYAKELMRLIHRNEFCEDIAIWYDEFLTPGENFNEEIARALEKSGLFAMVVTPHVVDEANYVMTTEYPMACRKGMPILPAELSATDRGMLREKYEGIPDCVNAYEEEAFSAALLQAVHAMALRERDGTPEHRFFIGLAYLNGIDVEVNYERAYRLIVGAAQDGVPEALEKLREMYEYGIGVREDNTIACAWQQKLASLRLAAYHENPNDVTGCMLALELGNLGRLYRDDNQKKRIYETMNEHCRRINNLFETEETKFLLAASYGNLASLSEAGEQKRSCYEKEQELLLELCEETNSVQYRQALAENYNLLALFYLAERGKEDYDLVAYWHEKEAGILEELCEETGEVKYRRALAECYDMIGFVRGFQEDWKEDRKEAKRWYKRAADVWERLLKETNTIRDRRDLADEYESLGDICKEQKQLGEAKYWYERRWEELSELRRREGGVSGILGSIRRFGMRRTAENLGEVGEAAGNLEEAEHWYTLNWSICQEEVREAEKEIKAEETEGYKRTDTADLERAQKDLSESWQRIVMLWQKSNRLERDR